MKSREARIARRRDRRAAIKTFIRTRWAQLLTLPWLIFKAIRNLKQLDREGAGQERLWAATMVHARHIVAVLPIHSDDPVDNPRLAAELAEDIWGAFMGDK